MDSDPWVQLIRCNQVIGLRGRNRIDLFVWTFPETRQSQRAGTSETCSQWESVSSFINIHIKHSALFITISFLGWGLVQTLRSAFNLRGLYGNRFSFYWAAVILTLCTCTDHASIELININNLILWVTFARSISASSFSEIF